MEPLTEATYPAAMARFEELMQPRVRTAAEDEEMDALLIAIEAYEEKVCD